MSVGAVEETAGADHELSVAQWVLRKGGEVVVHGDSRRIRDVNELPISPFRIHTINFIDIHTATAGDVSRFSRLADLRRLYFSSRIRMRADRKSGSDWEFLKALTNLEAFINSEPISSSPVPPDDEALTHFGSPEKLLELRLTRTSVEGKTLGRFGNLRDLDLSYSQLTDEGMQQLAGLKQLVRLNLRDTTITDAGLQALQELTWLQELDLQGTRISDKGLQQLAELTDLRKLNLLGTRITDESAKVLAGFGKLEELNLYRTGVSNLAMQSLLDTTSLRGLDLRYSQVTRAGVEALQKSLEHCSILFQDSGVTPSAGAGKSVVATKVSDAAGALKWVRGIGGLALADWGFRRRRTLIPKGTRTAFRAEGEQ